jgi:hypothetical protein
MSSEIEVVKGSEVPCRTRITLKPWKDLVETLYAATGDEWVRLPMSMWPGFSRSRVQCIVQSAMYSKKVACTDPHDRRIHLYPPEPKRRLT